ncbi:MAG TPA: TIGR03790 family protein [Verrucomicrobiae bacterium]|nr:TIGR03790 family protein [Verrucomicrobiae bacterium]
MKRVIGIFIFVFVPLFVRAGGDEVVVVYNSNLPESKMVAEHYAQVRHVPATQIFGFDLTTNEVMSRLDFRDNLQRPLAKKLGKAGLWKFGDVVVPATNGRPEQIENRVVMSKIRYAVLCYGVPLKIAPDSDLPEPVDNSIPPEMRRNEAAVDSDLALLPALNMRPRLTGPLPNWVYGQTNPAMISPTNGILIVTRLDGPAAEIANHLVDKSVATEATGLWGRAYFDARGLPKDDKYYLGDEWILGAATLCRQIGFETTVDTNAATFPADFPMSHIAIYAGWYDGNVSGPFALPKVEFMPGAFAYHLHSSSAASIRTANEFWVGPFLAKGATCTMGEVYEPYLAATPNIAVFLARWIAGDMTFGEAAIAAQPALSWQTTIIGDPLYKPFGKEPAQLHAQLVRDNNPLVEWSHLRIVNGAIARGAPLAQVTRYLENIPARTNSAVLTEKLGDLYAEQHMSESATEMYQRALTLNPSPEQKIRLRLEIGNFLIEQNHKADAIDDYKKLLAETPDYPGKNSVQKKIAALEQKDSATNSAARN